MVLDAFCLIPVLCILIFSKPVRKLCLLGDNRWHKLLISLDGDNNKTCNCFFCVCLQSV